MSDNNIQLYENFVINSKTEGFDIAMNKFQTNIVEQNLPPLEFNKYNDIANTLKIIDDHDPLLLKIDSQGPTVGPGINWWCLIYYVLWVISLVTWFVSCFGPQALFFCLAASINLIEKTYKTMTHCAGSM